MNTNSNESNITIDLRENSLVCYDKINLVHANNKEMVVLKVNSVDNKNADIINILMRLFKFDNKEQQVYEMITYLNDSNINVTKTELIKILVDKYGNSRVTYSRAIDNLIIKFVIGYDKDNLLIIKNRYDINNILKQENKFIVIKLD